MATTVMKMIITKVITTIIIITIIIFGIKDENVKLLKHKKEYLSKNNLCLLKRGKTFGKPFFFGMQKPQSINIKTESKKQE